MARKETPQETLARNYAQNLVLTARDMVARNLENFVNGPLDDDSLLHDMGSALRDAMAEVEIEYTEEVLVLAILTGAFQVALRDNPELAERLIHRVIRPINWQAQEVI